MGSTATKTIQRPRSVFSETQKRKVHHLFNVLDIDRNGQLQPNDFVNVGKKIVTQLKLSEDSRSARLILLKSHRLFVQLLTDLDNPELSLTLWDWVAFFRDQIESDQEGILDHYIQRTSRHIFDLFDMNKDKLISREEYANMLTIYNIPQDAAIQGFEELDENQDNFISADEMVVGLGNFFRSSDENAKGNLIFGRWD
ncbi:EF-hand domain-containing protein [Ekhidna sp.]|uniref:EF-hand domain-containing protein n=1 Tax=Ekhidna sp. TaxID=2608089 RepID=UPI003BAC7CB2